MVNVYPEADGLTLADGPHSQMQLEKEDLREILAEAVRYGILGWGECLTAMNEGLARRKQTS